MMQKMVNRIYRRKRFDKVKPVSRYEYEQKDVRNKLDIADIYMQLSEIKRALEIQNIVVHEVENREDVLVNIVSEDRRAIKVDLEELKYRERVEAYENGQILERIRRLFTGDPTSPMFEAEEPVKETRTSRSQNKNNNKEQERMNELLGNIESRGGLRNATSEEKEDLSEILSEIKAVIS